MENQLKYWINKNINFSEMEELFNKKIYLFEEINILYILKVIINKNKLNFILNHEENELNKRAKNKKKIYIRFFEKIVEKYNHFNCCLYILLNDHITTDKYHINNNIYYDEKRKNDIINKNKFYFELNEYPFFTIVKPPDSNLICLPDTMFLQDYNEWSRLPNNKSLNKYINNINKKSDFKNKKDIFIFKSQYWKYQEINLILQNLILQNVIHNKNTDETFVSIKDQIKNYKYFISTFLRWDTTYWQLLSNSVVFMITKLTDEILNTHPILYITFLYYYTKPYVHYIPIQLDKINETYEKYKNETRKLKYIASKSTKKMNSLSYDKVLNDFGNVLKIYNNIYNNNIKSIKINKN
jgi:hypothetical protein